MIRRGTKRLIRLPKKNHPHPKGWMQKVTIKSKILTPIADLEIALKIYFH